VEAFGCEISMPMANVAQEVLCHNGFSNDIQIVDRDAKTLCFPF